MNSITRQSLFLKFSSTDKDVEEAIKKTKLKHEERYGKINSIDTIYTMWNFGVMPTGMPPKNVKECISQAQLWGGQPKVEIICR